MRRSPDVVVVWLLQEIDRQHRASIAVQCSLQDLVDTFGIVPLKSPKSDSSNGRRSADIISGLQAYITELQDTVTKATRNNHLEVKLKKMQVRGWGVGGGGVRLGDGLQLG